jgi:hypothetical protein
MKKKTLLFIAAVTIIVTVVILVILIGSGPKIRFYNKINCYSEGFTSNFKEINTKFNSLQKDLLNKLNKKTNINLSTDFKDYFDISIEPMLEKIEAAMKNPSILQETGKKIKPADFSFNGDTIDKSIIKIHKNNPTLFNILRKTGFLIVSGRIVASEAWISSNNTSLIDFWKCTTKIDWNDIKTWKGIQQNNSLIMSCISQ